MGDYVFEPEIETMNINKLRELQEKKLMKMVRYAYDNAPIYKKKFKEAGVSIDDIKSAEDITKVPFTVKNDLRDYYPYGILAVPLEEVKEMHASSGTTGIPTVVTYTENDLRTWRRLMARSYAAAGVTKSDIVQNAYGYGLFTGGLGFHYGSVELGAMTIPTATGNTKRQLRMMKDMKTTVLCSTPSYALYLAEAAKKEGYDPLKDFNLKIGMFGAEPWSEEARKKIQDSLGLRAHDLYGMSELYGPGVAAECEHQKGLHIWADEFYVEVIDPKTGEHVDEGKKGELVFTMLSREAMPLLRYRTKDLAVVTWEECECGRTHPRIMRIGGRADDMLIVGGVNVFPSQIEEVLMNIPELNGEQFQIILQGEILESLHVKVEVKPGVYNSPQFNEEELKKKVSNELQAVLTLRARVELAAPEELPRTEGKAKRIIDKRSKR